ncbi:Uncharacterised protein [Moraxella lacunata]|uniref:Uncharacterized protein n=1 Tax=Moraxella lacunata TaxID=477 RepID=A0A378TT56_MORLA|nr:DUF4913 domain-containing protein [Moraxella lacunata]STZ63917.1 Uncharacterised protein [Moraxella lacunata]
MIFFVFLFSGVWWLYHADKHLAKMADEKGYVHIDNKTYVVSEIKVNPTTERASE